MFFATVSSNILLLWGGKNQFVVHWDIVTRETPPPFIGLTIRRGMFFPVQFNAGVIEDIIKKKVTGPNILQICFQPSNQMEAYTSSLGLLTHSHTDMFA